MSVAGSHVHEDANMSAAEKRHLSDAAWTAIAAVSIGGAILVVLGVFWALGLLEVNNKKNTGSSLTAVLAFIGTLLTGAVSFLGLVLKRQSEQRVALESDRNQQNKLADQRRLELDSAVQAAKLLSNEDGSPASSPTTAAALLTLANLNQLDLAVALLLELWPPNRISSEIASMIIDLAFRMGSESTQVDGASILYLNRDKLRGPSGETYWPNSLGDRWRTDLPFLARHALAQSYVTMCLTPRASPSELIEGLWLIWTEEPEGALTLKGSAGLLLGATAEALPTRVFPVTLLLPSGEIKVHKQDLQTAQKWSTKHAHPTALDDRADDIRDWAAAVN